MLLTLLPEAKEVLKNVFFKLGITGKESVWIKNMEMYKKTLFGGCNGSNFCVFRSTGM